MNKVNTDQKLELIRSIRMQNQHDRNLCRERERLLYGNGTIEKGELYSTENAITLPGADAVIFPPKKETGFLTGFRIRLFIALVLFGVFIFLDRSQIDLNGVSTGDFYKLITQNFEVPSDWFGNIFDLS